MSRTAAPLPDSARPIAPRASVTSLASSASSSLIALLGLLGRTDQDRTDSHPAARVWPALGTQTKPVPRHLGAGQRDSAQLQRQQSADGVDVEILIELDVVQLAEVFDG